MCACDRTSQAHLLLCSGPCQLLVSVYSDEDVQMDNRLKAQGPSKRPTQEDANTAYGEGIESMNEEYKIWRVARVKATLSV